MGRRGRTTSRRCAAAPCSAVCAATWAQGAYDKQALRGRLSENGRRERFEAERAAGRDPTPPAIPAEVISMMTARYAAAYVRLTGRAL